MFSPDLWLKGIPELQIPVDVINLTYFNYKQLTRTVLS